MPTKRTPNKGNMATKSQNTTTGQGTPTDQGTATAAARAVKQGAAIQAALKQRIKDAQTAAQNEKYNPFIFTPTQWRAEVNFSQFPLVSTPPAVPKFVIKDRGNIIPIGITHDEAHSYNDSHNVYYRVAYITTSLHAKTCAPWYKVVAASGKILKANPREYNLLPKYQDKLERLKLMMDFRTRQRDWELELLKAIHKSNLVDLYTKATMTKIHTWVKQERRKEDNSKYNTFFYSEPATLNNALITDLSKPQTRQATATKAKGKKHIYYKIHSDSDDKDNRDQVILPTDPADYIAWIANRHAAWDTSTPTHEEDLTEKYGLPDNMDPDQTKWPSAMKGLGITALHITKDIIKYPWGKPAFALHNTLKTAPGYTKDSIFSDAARKALHRLE
ncbi:hypothetical protein CNMCM5623_002201 [Aspergillus felis]|uniref:Uncharacterized protein n=1 Tax=Aspergillus felis TaxID=1287682 RepID=A0A8H6QAK8_9EURO|nr:hypothetical protein CNMCM5623_002201 [Aspergillus felis]